MTSASQESLPSWFQLGQEVGSLRAEVKAAQRLTDTRIHQLHTRLSAVEILTSTQSSSSPPQATNTSPSGKGRWRRAASWSWEKSKEYGPNALGWILPKLGEWAVRWALPLLTTIWLELPKRLAWLWHYLGALF